MTAPIGSVDNQIVAVIRLIGQAALDDTSDDRRHLCRFGDGIVGRRALKAMLGKGALHGPDDVAALTHAAKRIVHRSEEHTSELQSLMRISYAVFCLKKKKYVTNKNINAITKHVLTSYILVHIYKSCSIFLI